LLKAGTPEGVAPSSKETYLSDEQFLTVFGMNQEQFAQLKDWKKKELKKANGLF
jgi:hypothetical protein